MNNQFLDYGDVNFFDYGVMARMTGYNDTEVEVITCALDCNTNLYVLTHDIIDIADAWINRKEVESYAGTTNDVIQYACDILSYYGTQDTESIYRKEMTEEEVRKYMKNIGVEI